MGTLDAETIDMFAATLRGVLRDTDGDATAALVDAGWREVLAEDEAAIVPVLFRLQGAACARSGALDDVVLQAAGREGAVVHPLPGRAIAIAVDGRVDGLAYAPIDGLDSAPVGGLDPALGLWRVSGSTDASATDVVDGAAGTAAARRALAYELIGVATTMLSMATEHAKTRMQYGQPIGVFQAVKFRLADVLVAVQAAEVVAEEGWGDQADMAANAAKCLAGRAFRLAAENCLQVLGAIGFTWEHDLHRFIRRGLVLDVLHGSSHDLRREIGTALAERGAAPRLGTF